MDTVNGSSRFFSNTGCEYFPCHQTGLDEFNCLFCYCPMYYGFCMGEHAYVEINGSIVKDCTGCDFPHRPENYDTVILYLRTLLVGGNRGGI